MILGAATCIKVLLPILAGIFLWLKFKNTLSTRCRAGLAVLCVAFACIANMVAGHVPPLTDTITLTALGETGQAGKGQEVFISEYTVDDESYTPEPAMDGKWFRYGKLYGWRPETDDRQPSGTTRSVELEVPVGWERAINFSSNPYRGWVEIDDGQGIKSVDTSITSKVSLSQSNKGKLVLNQVRQLVVYGILILSISTVLILNFTVKAKKHDLYLQWWDRHRYTVLYGCIAVLALTIMVVNSTLQSFWLDEVCELYFLQVSSIKEVIDFSKTLSDPTPPLFNIIAWVWYRMVPYGEAWLRLLPELFAALGVFLVGLCAKSFRSPRSGLIASILAATSSTVLMQCGIEFRGYGFYFAMSAFALFVYLKRIKYTKNWKGMLIPFTIGILLLAYSHYFGAIICGLMFLFDCVLVAFNKMRPCYLTGYILAGVLYLPWVIQPILHVLGGGGNIGLYTWQGHPSVSAIDSLIKFLLGNSKILYWVFFTGFIFTIYSLYKKTISHVQVEGSIDFTGTMSVWVITATIIALYVYGRWISPDTFSLWVDRYFIGLIPFMLLVCSWMIDMLINHISKMNAATNHVLLNSSYIAIAVVLIITTHVSVEKSETKLNEPFRQTAEWINNTTDIYKESTLVLTTFSESKSQPWNLYYLARQNPGDMVPNVLSQYDISNSEILEYDTIYLCSIHNVLRSDLANFLKSNYTEINMMTGGYVRIYKRNIQ